MTPRPAPSAWAEVEAAGCRGAVAGVIIAALTVAALVAAVVVVWAWV